MLKEEHNRRVTAITGGGTQAKSIAPNPTTAMLFRYSSIMDNIDGLQKL
jgi:hypothetical protein